MEIFVCPIYIYFSKKLRKLKSRDIIILNICVVILNPSINVGARTMTKVFF